MFTLAFDHQNRVLLAHFSGVFSSEDIAGLDAATIALIAREGPLDSIVDFGPVEAWAVPMSKLVQHRQDH
jgi:hypothetical protein